MTDNQTPPDWVLIEAAKRTNRRPQDASYDPSFRALCDMIEKHEQPPVDRKLLCARRVRAETYAEASPQYDEIISGKHDEIFDADFMDMIRAIELWEEGFGK